MKASFVAFVTFWCMSKAPLPCDCDNSCSTETIFEISNPIECSATQSCTSGDLYTDSEIICSGYEACSYATRIEGPFSPYFGYFILFFITIG